MKRKFISHIAYEKNPDKKEKKNKKRNYVEDLVCGCYVTLIKEMINAESEKRCNGCSCSFDEKIDLFFTGVMVKLMNNNDEVVKRFNDNIEANPVLYNLFDVINARKMLKCNVHREKFCKDNQFFFKESILK